MLEEEETELKRELEVLTVRPFHLTIQQALEQRKPAVQSEIHHAIADMKAAGKVMCQ